MRKRGTTIKRRLRKAADQPGTREYQKLAEDEGQRRLPLGAADVIELSEEFRRFVREAR
jgi:hypothetical protein